MTKEKAMTKQQVTERLAEVIITAYDNLMKQPNNALSKKDIKELLNDDLQDQYTVVVQALVDTTYVVRTRGYYGGVSINPAATDPPTTISDRKKDIISALSEIDIVQTTEGAAPEPEEKADKKERAMYEPLQAYLRQTGLYDIVDIGAKLQGRFWENADWVGFSFQRELQYHSQIDLRVTAFEVKRTFPAVNHVQQTAAYLTYANAAYLCYVDSQFKGKGIDSVVQRLRDEGIWDQAELLSIGLIVAYYPQEKSKDLRFQTIRHVPHIDRNLLQIEQGINLWATPESKARLKKTVASQIHRVMTGGIG